MESSEEAPMTLDRSTDSKGLWIYTNNGALRFYINAGQLWTFNRGATSCWVADYPRHLELGSRKLQPIRWEKPIGRTARL